MKYEYVHLVTQHLLRSLRILEKTNQWDIYLFKVDVNVAITNVEYDSYYTSQDGSTAKWDSHFFNPTMQQRM
jgi:hypothetical protein